MISVEGFRIIPYPEPKGNFAENFKIKVTGKFTERDIMYDNNNECKDEEILYELTHFMIKNNLLDREVENSDGIEIIVSPINFRINCISSI